MTNYPKPWLCEMYALFADATDSKSISVSTGKLYVYAHLGHDMTARTRKQFRAQLWSIICSFKGEDGTTFEIDNASIDTDQIKEISNAARLVVGHVTQFPMQPPKVFIGDVDGIASCRDWQPWADTEAGRSDALVLLAAVEKYAAAQTYYDGYGSDWYGPLHDAMEAGNVEKIQAATFAAAAAIGAHIKGEEGK